MEDKLAKFVKVIDAGSYTKAARELQISQPALTMAVAKLERELAATLIVKGERPLKMTHAGRVAYATGAAQLTAMDMLRTKVSQATNKKPDIRIGMIDSIAAVLSQNTDAFDHLENAADMSLVVNNSRFLQNLVTDHKLDLALVVERLGVQPLHGKRIGCEPMVLVCAPQNLQIMQADIAKHKIDGFISYDQDSMTYRCIESGLAEVGLTVSPKLKSTYPEFMMQMVMRGKGSTVLPYFLVRDRLIDGALVAPRVSGGPIIVNRPFSAVNLQSRTLSEYLEVFITEVSDILQQLNDDCKKQLN